MNIDSTLTKELRDKAYRDAYTASQISIGLPFQIRALRASRNWTQGKLAKQSLMSQPRVSEIERPGARRLNLDTLLRLASAFDVALEVRFVPFGKLVDHSERFDPDSFSVKSFDQEISELEQRRNSTAHTKHDMDLAASAKSVPESGIRSIAQVWPENLRSVTSPGTNLACEGIRTAFAEPIKPAEKSLVDFNLSILANLQDALLARPKPLSSEKVISIDSKSIGKLPTINYPVSYAGIGR